MPESSLKPGGDPELIYNIAFMQLKGLVDGITFNAIAYSGGRGGTKTPGAELQVLVNNPFLTGVKLNEKKKNKGSIGGPLPMGLYSLSINTKAHNQIRLTPITGYMKDRGGFLIHGRGLRGSDGCIVPADFTVVLKLCDLVKKRKKNGEPDILLKVCAFGDLDFFQKKIETWRHIA